MSGDVAALADDVDRFVRVVIIPCENDPRQGPHGPAPDFVRELQALARGRGLLAPHLPIEWGGRGLSHRDTATIFKAAGYSTLGPLALNIMAPDEGNMHLLGKIATVEQQAAVLGPLAAGAIRSCFLMTEPWDAEGAGSDPSMLKTVAEPTDGGWLITGRKTLATGAVGASVAIVMAMAPQGATLFLLDMTSRGVIIERVLDTIDEASPGGHAVVTLDGAFVPHDRVLGDLGKGFENAQVRLAPARLTHCMRWWGAARRAHHVACDYARRRHAFGKPLIDHEGVGFMLADNEIDLRQASLLIDWCADALDEGKLGIAESSLTKVAVSEALFRVADRSVQVMGGHGLSRDTIGERVFRELRAFRVYDGPSEVHRWSMAKRIKREGPAL